MKNKINRTKAWIINHDDSNVFLVLYISLAVVLSIAISLFWLVVVVLIHFIFEVIKQSEISKGFKGVLLRASWELLLDFGLILFAFVIAVYMDIILGAAGIGAGARAGLQTVSKASARFAGWQRAIRGFFLSIDDLAQLTKFSKGKHDDSADKVIPKYGGWVMKWSVGEKFTVIFTIISFALILLAPFLTAYNFDDVIRIILEDLVPFPN